jgi:hypothetical protein
MLTVGIIMHEGKDLDLSSHDLASALGKFRYQVGEEITLQDGLDRVLTRLGYPYEREYILSAADRPDFLVDGKIAVEVKIKGSAAEALRQVSRYAKHPQIAEVLVVGTPAWLSRLPDEIEGKPLLGLRLLNSAF